MMRNTPVSLEDARRRLAADLDAEDRVRAPQCPADPALAADWRLRRELASLAPAALPAGLRRRVRARIAARTVWPVALAASVLLAVVLLPRLDAPAPTAGPDLAEVQQVGVALALVGAYTADGLERALRRGSASLDRPLLEPERLPYFEWIGPAISQPIKPLPPNQEYAR